MFPVRLSSFHFVASFLLVLLVAPLALAAPSITSLTPSSAAVGASVTIAGSGFGSTQGSSTVKFNGTTATVTSWSASSLVVTVPTGATTGNVVVTVSGTASNGKSFTVLPTPSISSLSPTSGAVGASVTISGSNFGSSQGSGTVKFNGTAATVTTWAASSIVVAVPSGATTGNVVVNASGVNTNGISFTVLSTPSISGLSPTSGAVGASVTISGSNFGATQGTGTVKFNGTAATVTSWVASSIVATVPSGATTGNVVVSASGVSTNGVSFTVVSAPSITSLSPTSGTVATSVTITGTNFGSTQGSSTVKFNGTTSTPTSWSATSIKAPVPSGATTGNVVVHASGVDSNGKSFTVTSTPSIASLSPTSGPVGTSVTVTGTNFGTTQGTSTIKFNGTTATPTTWSNTSIVVPVPTGATTGNMVVTVSGVASNGATFTVTTLVSISVTPANAVIAVIGGTQQFTATGTYSDNSTQNLTSSATWTSSASAVATISSAGLATAAATGQTTIQAQVGSVVGTTLLTVPGFKATGSLVAARSGATATLLNSGLVLVAGGSDANGNPLGSAELYNPSTGTFAATGSLNTARAGFTATLLVDGTVLIAGGMDSSGNLLSTAEIFSPTSGTFVVTGGLNDARFTHAATLLANGKVLLTGGTDLNGNGIASAEIFDPASASFLSTANMNSGRRFHTATLLNNGKVLVTGGTDNFGNTVNSAELYDPVAATFTTINSMNATRFTQSATLLNSGLVLIAGGYDQNFSTLASAELYDPVAGTFTLTGTLLAGRGGPTATLLNNAQVLFVGGTNQGTNVADAELYDPVAGTFSATLSPSTARYLHSATLLNNGSVLVAGGIPAAGGAYSSAELYQPASLIPANLVSISLSPTSPFVPLGTAQKFIATGTFSNSTQQQLSSANWNSSSASVASVSNDSTNQGITYASAVGSATISACTGTVCGSTTISVVAADPEISVLSPTSGPVGSALTITGSGFGAMEGKSSVTLNQSQATVTSWGPTSIVVAVPNDTSGNISVKVGGVESNLVLFTVLPTPVIANVSPSSGDVGIGIEIDGSNFGDAQSGSTITLNGVPVVVTSWSATTILGTVPASASTGNVVVTVGGVASNPFSFTVTSVPSIFALSPNLGPIGSQVTVSGADFGPTQGTSTVTFNGAAASVTGWSSTGITALVPAGAATGPVVVTVGGTASNAFGFTVPGPSNVTALSPTAGLVGTTVTITGSNFGSTQGPSVLTFDGVVATPTAWGPTQITATVPVGASSGNVAITTAGVTGSAAYFEVLTMPVLSALSVPVAAPNAPVTITGNGFGATQGTSTVAFNGVSATPTSWSATNIVVLAPTGFTTGPVVVTVAGIASRGITMNAAPAITGISPSTGVIGNSVTISGQNFNWATQNGTNSIVDFENNYGYAMNCSATPTSVTNTSLVVAIPTCAGSGPVGILYTTNPGYSTFSNTSNVTINPSITSLSPTSGTVATQVTINGGGFGSSQGASTVTFNGQSASPTFWSPNTIWVTPPVGASSGNVVVTANSIASNGMAFSVTAGPGITGVSPLSGPAGTPVTITGSGFGATQGTSTVTFNGVTAVPTGWGPNSIAVPVPSNATSGNLVVTSPTGVSSNPVSFTLILPPSISSLSQTSGSVGLLLAVYGSNFGNTQGSATVTLNGSTVPVSSWSSTSILITVPSGAASGNIVVNIPGLPASNGSSFTVVASPTITSTSPGSGPAGTPVTITGTGYTSPVSSNSVTFNGVAAVVTASTSTTVTTSVPEGATTGNVVVTTNNGPTNGFSFTVSSGATVSSLSPTKGGIGAVVTIIGIAFGQTQGGSSVKFNGTVATPSTWSDSSITVPVPSGATTGNVVVVVGGATSNGISFTVSTVSVASVSPSSGNTGQSVTISGSGFGSSKGSSSLTFNGTSASVTSWSNTAIVATIPSAATSGPIVVTVGGAPSDPLNFTIQPQITGISPLPAALGAKITITGENFGSSQGSSTITCDGVPITPSSWNSTSIVFYGCFNLGSNPVQVTVSNVSSDPASIQGIPVATVSSVTPSTAPNGARIRILGQNFGAVQGLSSISVNGTTATPTIWSNSSITLNVPATAPLGYGVSNLTVGGVAVALGIQVGTNSQPASLRITPVSVNLMIGGAQQFTAVDQYGQVRPEATWSVDNTNLASITSDYSPVLTAIAAGTVNLTATVQGVQVQTAVTISSLSGLSNGTVLWSVPPVPNGIPAGVFQAVPTAYGPATYSVQTSSDGTQTFVQGVTSDGQVTWETGLPWPYGGKSVPDANGGLLVMGACNASTSTPMSITDASAGGASLWQATMNSSTPGVCPDALPNIAVRQDGAVVVAPSMGVSPALLILDGQTGQQMTITPAIPPSTITTDGGITNTCDCFTPVGPPIVDSDGSIYFEYTVRNEDFTAPVNQELSTILWLMKIGPNGTTNNTQISSSNSAILWPGSIMPDGQGGIVATWIVDSSAIGAQAQNPYQGAHIQPGSGTVNPYNLPLAPTGTFDKNQSSGMPVNLPLVLGENGTAFVSYYSEYPNSTVASYNIDSGSASWSYQSPQGVNSMNYVKGGGLTVVDPQSNVVPLDSGGNQGTSLSLPSYSALQPGWNGTWQAQSVTGNVPLAQIQFPPIDWGWSAWAAMGGSPSPSGTSVHMSWYPQLDHCTAPPGCIGHYEAIYNALSDLVARLKDPTIIPGVNKTLGQLAQQKVFNLVGTDANGQPASTAGFLAYLSGQTPQFYDGTTSNYCYDSLTSGDTCYENAILAYLFNGQLVYEVITDPAADASALTRTPGTPFLSFLSPNAILFQSLGQNIGNESVLFHEALHGYTGLYDRGTILRPTGLMEKLSINPADKSCAVSQVLAIDVLSYSSGLDQTATSCE